MIFLNLKNPSKWNPNVPGESQWDACCSLHTIGVSEHPTPRPSRTGLDSSLTPALRPPQPQLAMNCETLQPKGVRHPNPIKIPALLKVNGGLGVLRFLETPSHTTLLSTRGSVQTRWIGWVVLKFDRLIGF